MRCICFNPLRLATVDRAVKRDTRIPCTSEIWKLSSVWDTMKWSVGLRNFETCPDTKCGCLLLTRLRYEYEWRKITLRSIGTKVITITQFVSISNHQVVMNPAFAFLFSLYYTLRLARLRACVCYGRRRTVSGPDHKYRTRYHPWTYVHLRRLC